MKNFIQNGDIDHRHRADRRRASGEGLMVGNIFGIAAYTSAEGEPVEISTIGVFQLPKLASAVIAAGARVAWDDTAKEVVLPGVGMVPIGIATLRPGTAPARSASGSTAW